MYTVLSEYLSWLGLACFKIYDKLLLVLCEIISFLKVLRICLSKIGVYSIVTQLFFLLFSDVLSFCCLFLILCKYLLINEAITCGMCLIVEIYP